jgi:hypothetical protein
VELIPGESIRVTAKMADISNSRDVFPFLVNKAAINLFITVSHPEDLVVRASPLHPSEHLFKTKVDEPNLKTWAIEGGLLPFQGIQLSWESKDTL